MGMLYGGIEEAKQYQAGADAAYQAGVSTAAGALASVQGAQGQVYGQIGKAEAGAQAAQAAAAAMGQDISSIRGTAAEVKQQAYNIQPYALTLQSYGDQLMNHSDDIIRSGKGLLGMSDQLLGLDASAGGIIGEYVRNVLGYDPDRKVASAAADVQQSFDNAKAQNRRDMARRGINPSSGAAKNQERLMSQYLAAALAGAKTNARTTGLQEQTTALRNALADALGMRATADQDLATGKGFMDSAITAQKGAADVQRSVADALAESGSLFASAASAGAAQANALTNAAQVFTQNAGAINSYLGNLVNAAGNVSKAQMEYGAYQADVAEGYAAYQAYQDYLSTERFKASVGSGGSAGGSGITWAGIKPTGPYIKKDSFTGIDDYLANVHRQASAAI